MPELFSEEDSGSENTTPLVGVSACLLGEPVRYDGGHKRNEFITDWLARFIEFVPICPETAIGMGVPRPPIHLVGDVGHPLALGVADQGLDVTKRLENYAYDQLESIEHLSGMILKKDSPSCGVHRVKVYRKAGREPRRVGQGIFTRILMHHHPLLPVEDECGLDDPVVRENFVNRVYTFNDWRRLTSSSLTPSRLIEFHTRHKYITMAHSQMAYRRMGRLLSNLGRADIDSVAANYLGELMTALKRRVTPGRHVNVMLHIMGYLKRDIDRQDKEKLAASIESYRRHEVPLIVPIRLLKHSFKRYPNYYISNQSYLQPHPEEMRLRDSL